MGPLIRTLLVWLLMLAVPAQAVAAATMAFCGPGHHGGGSSRGHAQTAASPEHTHHEGGAHNAGSASGVTAEPDELGAAAHADSASPNGAHADKQKCSVCAACCSLSAIPSMALAVPVAAFIPPVFSTIVPAVNAVAADGPDRPPRMVLA